MSASTSNSSHHQQQRMRRSNAGSPTAANSSSSNSSRLLQPIRATVPYQLLRSNQQSPTRSPSSFSVGSNTGPTSSRCSSPPSPTQALSSPGGSGVADQRLIGRQRRSPDSRSSPERRSPSSPICRGKKHEMERGASVLWIGKCGSYEQAAKKVSDLRGQQMTFMS
ncbi:GLCI1 protein, partial [Polypterus senegalus]